MERNKSLQNMEQSNKSEWEDKLMKLEEELKAKGKQLNNYVKQNEGSNKFTFCFYKGLVG